MDKELLKQQLERLKLIKKQPKDRHLEIYLGKTYIDMCLVKFDDRPIIEKDNKNEVIDLVIDTIIKYLEEELK